MSAFNKHKRRRDLRARDGDNCFYCGCAMRFGSIIKKNGWKYDPPNMATLEHLIDVKYGGSNAMDNLVLACKACNNGRNYMSYNEKLMSRGKAIA